MKRYCWTIRLILICGVLTGGVEAAWATDCNSNGSPDDLDLSLLGRVCWTDFDRDRISCTGRDGTGQSVIVASGLETPNGLAFDLASGHVYWADQGLDAIRRADLDGQNAIDIAIGTPDPQDIALDLVARKVYWVDAGIDVIMRANLDGPHPDPTPETLCLLGGGKPIGLSLDPVHGMIYWADADTGDILRGRIDAPCPGEVFRDNLPNHIHSVFVDPLNEYVYWTDHTDHEIWRCDLDSTGCTQIVSGAGYPVDIAVDPVEQFVYWTNRTAGKVQKAPLATGSPITDLATDLPQNIWGVALTIGGDCNFNEIPDQCDIASGVSRDCNGNTSPDECDLANGTSRDCQSDDVPDECQLPANDCNTNSVPDECDIHGGSSADLDSNGFPDECATSSIDCNANGLPDDLDLSRLGRVYWTDFANDRISFVDRKGADREVVVDAELMTPNGLAIDLAAGHIYWADQGLDAIRRANLDGTNVIDIAAGTPDAQDIALDLETRKVYWVDAGSDVIMRADLDGTHPDPTPETLCDLEGGKPIGVSLDSVHGMIYWADSDAGDIRRGPIDDPCPGEIVHDDIRDHVHAVLVDPASGHVYWSDHTAHRIWRRNLDLTGLTVVVDGAGYPVDIAVDPIEQYVYWTNRTAGRIQKAPLSTGSPITDLVTGLPQNIWGITLTVGDDCNQNDRPDECDLAGGTSDDCNADDLPDECDIAIGTSQDCQQDIIPDECQLVGNDCNTNAMPDDCELDFDSDGLIDDCDPDIDNDSIDNETDVCDFTPMGATPITEPGDCLIGTLRGDYDGDCDVDLADFVWFEADMTGPVNGG